MIELIVSHDGKNWIARSDLLSAEAPTLEELDNKLRKMVKEKGYLEPGKKLDFFMAFDNSTIPRWMRQYSQHYFNRIIQVESGRICELEEVLSFVPLGTSESR